MPTPNPSEFPIILPLASEQAVLSLAGGKGANLARLARAGLPVPGGFVITVRAYRAFLEANRLVGPIAAALPEGDSVAPEILERASRHIRALFETGSLPPDLEQTILDEYERIGAPAVAVRSSATAEDLPEMSFAGQQDTYLNVLGEQELVRSVVRCWSSLWTARAIGYRARNRVDHAAAALAVVVQQMVPSQASGVLFTANPLTGLRSETVIDASFGLGEALVSGQVEPDHYVVDHLAGRIISKTLGAKAVSIRPKEGGGTALQAEVAGDSQALPDDQILALARLGDQAASLYGSPQDIEWAWADGNLYLLQSRPVTSLFPVPDGLGPADLKVMFSFAAAQGLLDPITPLGREFVGIIFAAGAAAFGIRVTPETQTALYTAGERLWLNITSLIRSTPGRKVVRVAVPMADPATSQAIVSILEDPRLQPTHPGIRPRTLLRLARFFLPLAGNTILNLIRPEPRRRQIITDSERLLALMAERAQAIRGDRRFRLAQQLNLMPELAYERLPRTLVRFVSLVDSAVIPFALLNKLVSRLSPGDSGRAGWDPRVLAIIRGVQNNPTTEMDLDLWQAALSIRKDPASRQAFAIDSAPELATRFQLGALPAVAQEVVGRFLERYGSRGLGEVDIGRPRWREDPAQVIEILASYLTIEDERLAPEAVFERGAQSADETISSLVEAARRSPGGWIKAPLVRFLTGRARALMGVREYPKFFAVRMMGILRQSLLETGAEFVQAGELERPDDLFFLRFSELKAFAAGEGEAGEWRELIVARREANARECLRRQIPRLLLSDGRAFYGDVQATGGASNMITGSPVSPGSAKGQVRVVFDPRRSGLQPGEILVCPGTDPSWTPLFPIAAGLIMEVGGMMTHGAVVAREYGIPAIVGVADATDRIQTGQQIHMDGSSGQITLLSEPPVAGAISEFGQ